MQCTEKYFEADAFRTRAESVLLAAVPDSRTGGGLLALEGTVFYPEGGGQPADRGTLTLPDGTELAVTDVHEQDGILWHSVPSLPDTAVPGITVEEAIDWDWRFDKMQQHTGEHILSGILHRMFGAENVGFHIGAEAVRMDTSVPISAEGLRAAELAGLETIPAILMQVSDSDSAVMAFIENIQRQNLSFLEEAEGYRNMMEDYGLTQEELAAKLSKSQSSIANKLRILKLEDSVKKLLLEHHFTERHARALLKLPDEESRLFVLAQMIQEEMNVKKTEELVEATLEQMRPRFPEKGEQKEKRYVRSSDFRLFTNTIKQSVEVIRRSGVDVVYEDKQDADCCEILIRIRKNAVESA